MFVNDYEVNNILNKKNQNILYIKLNCKNNTEAKAENLTNNLNIDYLNVRLYLNIHITNNLILLKKIDSIYYNLSLYLQFDKKYSSLLKNKYYKYVFISADVVETIHPFILYLKKILNKSTYYIIVNNSAFEIYYKERFLKEREYCSIISNNCFLYLNNNFKLKDSFEYLRCSRYNSEKELCILCQGLESSAVTKKKNKKNIICLYDILNNIENIKKIKEKELDIFIITLNKFYLKYFGINSFSLELLINNLKKLKNKKLNLIFNLDPILYKAAMLDNSLNLYMFLKNFEVLYNKLSSLDIRYFINVISIESCKYLEYIKLNKELYSLTENTEINLLDFKKYSKYLVKLKNNYSNIYFISYI